MSGRRSQRTYTVRAGSETWAFVPHPEVSTWWFRCDVSVVLAKCPDCRSPRGRPCRDRDGTYRAYTHYMRRDEAKKATQSLEFALGVMVSIEKPGKGKGKA